MEVAEPRDETSIDTCGTDKQAVPILVDFSVSLVLLLSWIFLMPLFLFLFWGTKDLAQ